VKRGADFCPDRGGGFYRLNRIVIALWLCACTDSDVASDSGIRDFSRVAISISGGTCAACWRVLAVEAPGVLSLEDEAGEERFELREAEYEAVQNLVNSGDFRRAVDESKRWNCALLVDVDVDVRLEVDAGAAKEVRLSDGCFARCDEPGHPFMALKQLLFEYKEQYMQGQCPPNEDRYPEYCGIAPEPPPPPESRMLCAVCLDDCGVPIPDGSPSRAPSDQ
jgi:hypothetical protein